MMVKTVIAAMVAAVVVCGVLAAPVRGDEEFDLDDLYLEDEFELDELDMEMAEEEVVDGVCGCGGDPVASVEAACGADVGEVWENTATTTALWQAINDDDEGALCRLLRNPCAAFVRAEDGRTGLHWAYEYARPDMVRMLVCLGAHTDAEDASGKVPRRLKPRGFSVDLSDL